MKKILIVCLLSSLAGFANAGLIEVNATDAGWYSQLGTHESYNTNYIAGNSHIFSFHNFFAFDLGSINETVTSATLELYSYDITGTGIYNLFDVITPTETLTAGGNGLLDVYDDLASGITFGAIDLNPSQGFQLLQIVLNESALAVINSTDGLFSMGGSFATNSNESYAFGVSDSIGQLKLILSTASTSVPQPGSLALFAIGLLGLGYCRNIKNA